MGGSLQIDEHGHKDHPRNKDHWSLNPSSGHNTDQESTGDSRGPYFPDSQSDAQNEKKKSNIADHYGTQELENGNGLEMQWAEEMKEQGEVLVWNIKI